MKILMVCLGNICRSPLAEGILQKMADENNLGWEVDSAGTGGYHNGEPPNPNSVRVAKTHDLDISKQISREIKRSDMQDFDLIMAMDAENYNFVKNWMTETEVESKLRLIMNYAYPDENRTIPDPWFDHSLYETVYDMIYLACEGIMKQHSMGKSNGFKPIEE